MKRIFSALLVCLLLFSGAWCVLAEQQYQSNGTNIGIANKTNLVGCSITRSGEIATINCQTATGPITITGNLTVTGTETVRSTFTGVNWNEFSGGIGEANWQALGAFRQGINWYAVPQGLTSGINWVGADLLARGMNWTDIRAFATSFGGDHSGINWQSLGV